MGIAIALFLMHVLETMFFVGIAGSSIVVVISFIEDIQELVDDESPHSVR
jgi:hypothetical protein